MLNKTYCIALALILISSATAYYLFSIKPSSTPSSIRAEQLQAKGKVGNQQTNQSTPSDGLMTPKQLEKYNNLSDADKQKMTEILTTTEQTKSFISESAQKYLDLQKDDERFEQLDAKAEATIAELERQLKEQNAQNK